MRIELLPETGNFYKTNLHCHTTISDGKHTPEEIKKLYMEAGYSAVCYTDHEVLVGHKELCDENFIALHGYEVAIKKDFLQSTGFFMPVYHFNLIAEDPDNLVMPWCFLEHPSKYGNGKYWREKIGQYDKSTLLDKTEYNIEWINRYLEAVSKAGFLVTYNHPMWSLHNGSDYRELQHLHAIEVINGGCAGMNDNTSLHFEQLLRAGSPVLPVGGDDTHSDNELFLGWTMIKAPELSYKSLIEAYKKGDCYASEGPRILSLFIEDGQVVVKTSPASSISLHSEGRFNQKKISRTELYTEARFDYLPEKCGRYFRIEVKDERGFHAFSRAYFTNEISAKQ